MKKAALLLLALVSVIGLTSQVPTPVQDFCKSSETRKKCKELLKPYKYDASKVSKFTFRNKVQKKEIEIPLYIGEKYQFVFSTEGLPQPVDIEIYDKKSTSKKRKLLFSNKEVADEEFTFQPDKSRKLYINYTVPATNDTIKKGCVIFVLGYQPKSLLKKG